MALAGTRLGITKQLSAREPQRVVGTQKKVDTLKDDFIAEITICTAW